jgi:hypothetical protein
VPLAPGTDAEGRGEGQRPVSARRRRLGGRGVVLAVWNAASPPLRVPAAPGVGFGGANSTQRKNEGYRGPQRSMVLDFVRSASSCRAKVYSSRAIVTTWSAARPYPRHSQTSRSDLQRDRHANVATETAHATKCSPIGGRQPTQPFSVALCGPRSFSVLNFFSRFGEDRCSPSAHPQRHGLPGRQSPDRLPTPPAPLTGLRASTLK